MLNRSGQLCDTCQQPFVLRLGVGLNERNPLAFPCPNCRTIIRAVFHRNYEDLSISLQSKDIAEIDLANVESENWNGINVYSDIPVHRSLHGKGLDRGGSAFLWAFANSDGECASNASKLYNSLNSKVVKTLPWLRRACGNFRNGNSAMLRSCLVATAEFSNAGIPRNDYQALSNGLLMFFDDFFTGEERTSIERDVISLLNRASTKHRSDYIKFLQEIHANGYLASLNRLVDVSERTLTIFDAAIPGIVVECWDDQSDAHLDEYRLFRDDYTELQALFIDTFEVSSKQLAYVGLALNLANRKDLTLWSNNKRFSLQEALKMTAWQREFISGELPKSGLLFSPMNRAMRNKFGHFNIRYEPQSGFFTDDAGLNINAISFHRDFLNQMRVLTLLISVSKRLVAGLERLGLT